MQSIPPACYSVSLRFPHQPKPAHLLNILSAPPGPESGPPAPSLLFIPQGPGKVLPPPGSKCLPLSQAAFLLGCESAAGRQLLKGKDGSSSPHPRCSLGWWTLNPSPMQNTTAQGSRRGFKVDAACPFSRYRGRDPTGSTCFKLDLVWWGVSPASTLSLTHFHWAGHLLAR